jgi:signal transduction histidine kinase
MRGPEAVLPLLRLRLAFDPILALARRSSAFVPAFRTSMIGLLTAAAYYAGSQIGFALTPTYSPISTFWPPNAILLSILLLAPLRIWWVLVLAVLPAHLLIQLRAGIPVLSALGWFAGNTGEALLGAACIRLFKRDKPLFKSTYGVLVFGVFGVLLPVFLTSFLDSGGVILSGMGRNYWTVWTTRLTSNIVSDLTIVPIILILGLSGIAWLREIKLAQYFEAGLLAVAVIAVTFLVFSRESSTGQISVFIYAPLLLLIWAAVRFGCGGLSASLLAVALISLWNTVHGRGPLGMLAPVEAVIWLRISLTVLAMPLMLLAASLVERQADEEALSTARGTLIHIHEQECERFARRLHTDIAGRLTLVGLGIEQLLRQSNSSVRSAVEQLHCETSRACEDVIGLCHELHPFMVEYLGLARALEKLCRDNGARSGMTINFSAENVPLSLPAEVSYRFFGVARAALENVIQHSHANTADVQLSFNGRVLLLRIADAGVGMEPQSAEGTTLAWMREQLFSLNGTIEITSSLRKGVTVEASVPLKITQ